ncbi:MAG: DUF11 domain-containing protein, partial [bacterium]
NLRVWDTLPPGVAVTAVLDGGTYFAASNRIEWTLGTLDARATRGLQYTVTPDGSVPAVAPNCAALDYDDGDGVLQQRVQTCSGSLYVRQPRLIFQKFIAPIGAPAPVARGGTFTYVIDVFNQFNFTATNITVWDSLPPDTTFVGTDCGATYDAGRHQVDWLIPSLGPKQDVFCNLTVVASTTQCMTCCSNIAYLAYGSATFSISSNDNDPVTERLLEPVISVTELVPSNPVVLDEPLVYVIRVGNFAMFSATNVTVRDALPSGFVFVAAEGGTSVNMSGGTVTWTLPVLEPGMELTLTVTGSATGCGAPIGPNNAIGSGENIFGCALPSGTSMDQVYYFTSPALALTMTPSAEIVAKGSDLGFTLTLRNIGDDTALNIVVWDTLAAGATSFVGCVPPPGGSCAYDPAFGPFGRVEWTLPRLDPGASVSFSATALVGSPGWSITPNGACAYSENRVGCARPPVCVDPTFGVDVDDAFLALFANADPDPAPEGCSLKIALTLNNLGALAATNIVVWDSLPPGAVYLGCNGTGGGTCSESGGIVSWTPGPLPPDGVAKLDIDLIADPRHNH